MRRGMVEAGEREIDARQGAAERTRAAPAHAAASAKQTPGIQVSRRTKWPPVLADALAAIPGASARPRPFQPGIARPEARARVFCGSRKSRASAGFAIFRTKSVADAEVLVAFAGQRPVAAPSMP